MNRFFEKLPIMLLLVAILVIPFSQQLALALMFIAIISALALMLFD